MVRAAWTQFRGDPIPFFFGILLFLITLFPNISTVLIIVLAVFWALEGGWKERFRFLAQHKVYLIVPLFFLLHLLSLLYSSNLSVGFKKIETLLSLLLIPIMLPTFRRLEFSKNIDHFKWAFILGVFANFLFCAIRATALFLYEFYARREGIVLDSYPYTNYFFYSYLSYFMHYGYVAMYVNVAIAILLTWIAKGELKARRKRMAILFIICLSVFVLMLYSKAGILALLIIFAYFIAYEIYRYKNFKRAGIVLSFMLILGFVLYQYVPYTQERIQGMIDGLSNTELDPKSHDSTQLRVFVWKASRELIQANWWMGYGLGDASETLLEKYKERGFIAAYEEDLNAHNQYFQTALNVGFLGVFLLILYFFQLFRSGIRSDSLQLQLFALISFLVFFFEAYLQTQKGVYYFAFLSVLLLAEGKALSSSTDSRS